MSENKRSIMNLEDDGSVKEWKSEPKEAESEYKAPLPYGGYCNNPSCTIVSVKGSTDPKCNCGWLWSSVPGKMIATESLPPWHNLNCRCDECESNPSLRKPASSSEFDERAARHQAISDGYVQIDNKRNEIWQITAFQDGARWQHARDAEEIEGLNKVNASLEDCNDEYVKDNQKLTEENQRLNRIILKELTENDELGCEYTYVNALRESNRKLTAALEDISEHRVSLDKTDLIHSVEGMQTTAREALEADGGAK